MSLVGFIFLPDTIACNKNKNPQDWLLLQNQVMGVNIKGNSHCLD
jgi:hypothetical protein